jgi:hypothetical protein
MTTLELPSEIFVALLEKLELSQGFLNLEMKTNKPHTSRTLLLPTKEVMGLIRSAKQGDAEGVVEYVQNKNEKLIHKIEQAKMAEMEDHIPVQAHHNVPQAIPTNNINMSKYQEYAEYNEPVYKQPDQTYQHSQQYQDQEYQQEQNYEHQDYEEPVEITQNHSNSVITVQEESVVSNRQKMDPLQSELLSVFEMYCSLGDPLNSQFLSNSKFIKMVLQVCENTNNELEIEIPDIELIFAKSASFGNEHQEQNDSTPNVINFDQFMFSLELIAMKAYDSPSAVHVLIQDHILPLKDQINQEVTSSSEHIIQLMEILKDEEMANLLELIHKTLYPYYNFYSNDNDLMTLDHFAAFCQDFKIFPDILPDELVVNFFKTLSNFY